MSTSWFPRVSVAIFPSVLPLAGDVKDVLIEFVMDRWGLKLVTAVERADPIKSVRVEGGALKIGVMNYELSIPVAENFKTLFEIIFDAGFTWLSSCWQVGSPVPGYDLRDTVEKNVEMVERTAERCRNLPPISFREIPRE